MRIKINTKNNFVNRKIHSDESILNKKNIINLFCKIKYLLEIKFESFTFRDFCRVAKKINLDFFF